MSDVRLNLFIGKRTFYIFIRQVAGLNCSATHYYKSGKAQDVYYCNHTYIVNWWMSFTQQTMFVCL